MYVYVNNNMRHYEAPSLSQARLPKARTLLLNWTSVLTRTAHPLAAQGRRVKRII